jgi:hypothetical protein
VSIRREICQDNQHRRRSSRRASSLFADFKEKRLNVKLFVENPESDPFGVEKTMVTMVTTEALQRPCAVSLYCWSDCARSQASYVSTLKSVHLSWSHQHLKKRLDTLAVGCMKWNVWQKLLWPFDTCAERESSASWCLAACTGSGSDTS